MRKLNGQPQNHPGRPKGAIRTKNPLVRAVLEAIDRAGYTDSFIAVRAGLGKNELSNWRRGEHDNPTVARLCWVLESIGAQVWVVDNLEVRNDLVRQRRRDNREGPRRPTA